MMFLRSLALSIRVLSLSLLAGTLAPSASTQDPLATYSDSIQPILKQYCFKCHGPDKEKGDIRLDTLNPDTVSGPDAFTWEIVREVFVADEMPPAEEPQPTADERRALLDWLDGAIERAAAAHQGDREPVLRRLTKPQYTNTLQQLLGLPIDFGRPLPDDAKSRSGFTNNGAVLQSSPLHLETWQDIARRALDQAIQPGPKPEIAHYRVTFGAGIGKGKVAGRTGGYQSVPLSTDLFTVEILDAAGKPRVPADDAERKELETIQRRISVGLRGSGSDRFQVVDEGMMLYSALPHVERVPKSWQGPSPNLKLEMQRVFPERGDFVMRVRASRGYIPPLRKQLLLELDDPSPLASLEDGAPVAASESAQILRALRSDQRKNVREDGEFLVPGDVPKPAQTRLHVEIPADGFYQFDIVHPALDPNGMPQVRLQVDNMKLDMRPDPERLGEGPGVMALGAAGVRKGRHRVLLGGPFFAGYSHLIVTPLGEDHPLVTRIRAQAESQMEQLRDKLPAIRTLVGTRTDDGMDYATFDRSQVVDAPLGQPKTYTFHGRLENLPIPEPESGDTEVLSGFMLLGLWNDHLVKSGRETGPPLLVESIEFEAPYYPVWPPATHTAVFHDSPLRASDPEAYTREVLERFLTRAFRRPLVGDELERYLEFWRRLRGDFDVYEEGVREVLVAALCSPKLLFLAEPDPEAVPPEQLGMLRQHALASRLSYFLWNGPPDQRLLDLAAAGTLGDELLGEVDRMLDDPRSEGFVRAFTREWLRLDRLEQMTINPGKHPKFTRFVKEDMAEECYRFVDHAFREDLPFETLIDSDFAMLNQNLAEFYGVKGVSGPEFRPVELPRERGRGGLLAQGAFLAGHSDGTWPHIIKRAIWVKEKILGEHPPPPPPNVPDLDPETPGFDKLTIKEQLEQHRNKSSCMDCHRRIDPYGFAFQGYSATGLLERERRGLPVDDATTLPDGTAVQGVAGLKAWLLSSKRDAVARNVLEQLYTYALGRDVHLADDPELRTALQQCRIAGYRMRAFVRSIVAAPSFSAL